MEILPVETMSVDALCDEIRESGYPIEEIEELQRRITIGEISLDDLPPDIQEVIKKPPSNPYPDEHA